METPDYRGVPLNSLAKLNPLIPKSESLTL